MELKQKPNDPPSFSYRRLKHDIHEGLQQLINVNYYELVSSIDFDRTTADLIDKLDQLQTMLIQGTKEYDETVILKALTIHELCAWHKFIGATSSQLAKDFERLKQTLATVEHFADQVNGFNVYLENLTCLVFNYKSRGEYTNCRLYVKKIEEAYDNYCNTQTEIPTHHLTLLDNTFEYTKRDFEMIPSQIGYLMWQAYQSEHELVESKYIVPAIQWLLYISNKQCEDSMPQILVMFPTVYDLSLSIFHRREFKQLEHVLAVAMSFLVRYRRTLPKFYRSQLNEGQGLIARVYVAWGKEIMEASLAKLNGESYKPIDNESFQAINEPDDIEYKIYVGQFPIEPVEGRAEIKKLVIRTKAWNKRATELLHDKTMGKHMDQTLSICDRINDILALCDK